MLPASEKFCAGGLQGDSLRRCARTTDGRVREAGSLRPSPMSGGHDTRRMGQSHLPKTFFFSFVVNKYIISTIIVFVKKLPYLIIFLELLSL
ncbi:hypothetical protein [Janthinobacterium lividum]|uniref:hypothetical protein n=1 Tax=Janthinobacterium lividum TaxID=29581 RepID=UPI00140AA756|nr:hypothetical protein [Janthinobacterium lividum]NHQ93857.1 hypothetical protein [Janthinobacterium lividum]